MDNMIAETHLATIKGSEKLEHAGFKPKESKAIVESIVCMLDPVLKTINARFKDSDKRMDDRFKDSDKRVDDRFKEADKREDERFKEADKRADERFKGTDKRLDRVDDRLDRIEDQNRKNRRFSIYLALGIAGLIISVNAPVVIMLLFK